MTADAEMYVQFRCQAVGFETFYLLARLAAGATKSGYGLKVSGTQIDIVRFDADAETVLATATPGTAAGHTYRLYAETDGTLTASRDGVPVQTANDLNYATGTAGFAFTAGFSTTFWDDALIEVIAPAPPAAPTDLTATCASGIGESTLSDKPASSFTADVYTGPGPLTVQFTDHSTNSPTSWLWRDESGTLSTDQNPLLVFAVGIHTVRQTASNAQGAGTPYQMTITANPPVVVTPPTDGTVTPIGLPGDTIQGVLGKIGYYAVDTGNHQVKIHGLTGTILKTVGGIGDTDGKFYMPTTCSVVNGRQALDRVTIEE
jgi:PKD repeat protein